MPGLCRRLPHLACDRGFGGRCVTRLVLIYGCRCHVLDRRPSRKHSSLGVPDRATRETVSTPGPPYYPSESINRLCSMLAWTPSAVVGPISSVFKASAAWRIAREARPMDQTSGRLAISKGTIPGPRNGPGALLNRSQQTARPGKRGPSSVLGSRVGFGAGRGPILFGKGQDSAEAHGDRPAQYNHCLVGVVRPLAD